MYLFYTIKILFYPWINEIYNCWLRVLLIFYKFLNRKNNSFPLRTKIYWAVVQRCLWFFIIHVQWKHIFNLRKDKKKNLSLQVFWHFHIDICVINRFHKVFWYFSCFFSKFFFRNLLARVPNKLASGWHLHHLDGTCDIIR